MTRWMRAALVAASMLWSGEASASEPEDEPGSPVQIYASLSAPSASPFPGADDQRPAALTAAEAAPPAPQAA